MSIFKFSLFKMILVIIVSLVVVSCDDDNSSNNSNNINNTNNTNNTNTNNTNNTNLNNTNNTNSNNTNNTNLNNTNNTTPRNAAEIVVNIHDADLQKINIIEVTSGSNIMDCHFGILKTGSVPALVLCDGTKAFNAGNSVDFYDIDSIPQDAVFTEDDGTEYVMGTTWQDGGNGTAGFNMTQNVYILELPNGRYGKIEVLSAISGNVTFAVFADPDGTDNLTCEEPL
ncbi:hypothetical protein KKF34_07700 [Myxococcota bacterium]|nr:hypothetical protein [Myxococcota bacterium]MBU1381172.1 hypothetical protein [Myxococcota bacterium]MBU1496744.1 hypothetical protein [Myxococcota bacterium]